MIDQMPILRALARMHAGSLRGRNILLHTHATDATCGFVEALHILGARISYVPIEYSVVKTAFDRIAKIPDVKIKSLESAQDLVSEIDVLVEDGARIARLILDGTWRRPRASLYGMEQTTSGIRFLEGVDLSYPVVNIAESRLKLEVENSMSTPESVLASVVVNKQLSFAQKRVLVIGYGNVGAGIAELCRAHGSQVVVIDSDPIRRVIAESRGFQSMDAHGIDPAVRNQDVVVSCTADPTGTCLDVEQFMLMKDGALVVNAGSGRGEVSGRMLKQGSFEHNRATISVSARGDDLVCVLAKAGMEKTVEILCSAHPANLRCGHGTAKDAMDMVFSLMALTAIETDPSKLARGILSVAPSVERRVASLSLARSDPPRPHIVSTHQLRGEARPWGRLYRFTHNKDGLAGFSVARASFKPGSSTDGHYHTISNEAYVVEMGAANIMTWDPKDHKTPVLAFDVKPGDYLVIPQGRAHRVFVTSVEAFECLVISSPPFSFWDQFFPPKIGWSTDAPLPEIQT